MRLKTFPFSYIGLSVMTILVSLSFFWAPNLTPVYAQKSPCTGNDCAQQGLDTVGTAFPGGAKQGLKVADIVKLVIDWSLYLAAIVAVIYIIIGGFLYITSAGNETQAGKGRETLKNALIGLTLVILSYIIVQMVYNFLINK